MAILIPLMSRPRKDTTAKRCADELQSRAYHGRPAGRTALRANSLIYRHLQVLARAQPSWPLNLQQRNVYHLDFKGRLSFHYLLYCSCALSIFPNSQGDFSMATDRSNHSSDSYGAWLTLDASAVAIALLLALAVKFNVLHNVPW
jgi:hypothetical protein